MKTENLWLSVVVGVGVLLGVVVGGYLSTNSASVSANADGPPMCTKIMTDKAAEECTDGVWSGWNLSDKPMRAPGYYNIMIPPHSRVYIGITKVTTKYKMFVCGTSPSTVPWLQAYTMRTNTVCAKEQRPPEKDPGDSAVTTVDTTAEEVGDTVEPKDVPIYE